MIASKNERNLPGFERLQYHIGALGAGSGDLLEVFEISRACFFLLGDGDGNVAGILDNVSDGFKARFQARNPNGRRTHVNPRAGIGRGREERQSRGCGAG